jgi:hypothetical protein
VLRDRTVPAAPPVRAAEPAGAERPAGGVRVLVTGEGPRGSGWRWTPSRDAPTSCCARSAACCRGRPACSGTALLGDGRVLLVLDLPGLLP